MDKENIEHFEWEESLWNGDGSNLFVLEWSGNQKCFHIQTIGDAIKGNYCHGFLANTSNDYVPIGLFSTADKAHQAASKLRIAYNLPDMFQEAFE